MEHTFDIEIAKKSGVNAAILYRNFQYWIAHNKANGKHLIDGRTWTYNSQHAFEELFPYMTRAHIRSALKILIDEGVLITGKYNKRAMDRTIWYAFKDEKTALLSCPAHWRIPPMGKKVESRQCKQKTAIKGENPIGGIRQCIGGIRPALPIPKPNSKPDKNKGIVNISENILELDLKIAEQKKLFMREIEQALRPRGKEVNTFAKITKWLVMKCQRRELQVSIFKDAIEWARQAALSTVTNKKGLFVAKVKEETGYRPEKHLLGGSQRAHESLKSVG